MTTQATTDWKNEIQRRRAVFLNHLLLTLILVGLAAMIFRFVTYPEELGWAEKLETMGPFIGGWLSVLIVWAWPGLDYRYRAIVIILHAYITGLIVFASSGVAGSGRIWLMLFQAMAFILLGPRAGIVGWAISILTYIYFGVASNLGGDIPGAAGDLNSLLPLLVEGATFLFATAVLTLILYSLDQSWQKALLGAGTANEQLQTRTRELEETNRQLRQQTTQLYKLEATAEIVQAGSSIPEPEKLLVEIVNRIQDSFSPIGVYYVGLFLLDETRRLAILSAVAGESEQPSPNTEIGYKLKLDGTSIVSRCITNRKTRTKLHGGESEQDENRFVPGDSSAMHTQELALPQHTQKIILLSSTPDIALPPRTQEIALPLHSRGNVLGALNLHSTQDTEFSEMDIAVLQTMANQISLAIDNANLVSQTQAALDEVQTLQRRYLTHAWQDFLTTQPAFQIDHTRPGAESETTPSNRVAASLRWLRREVMEHGQTMTEPAQQTDNPEGALMMVPLKIREQTIGTLSLRETDQRRQWTDEDVTLVETIAEQVALTIENLRLMDDTRRRAARERLVGELSEQMQRAPDIASLMYITAEGLNQALGGSRVFVRMGTETELTGETRTQAVEEPLA